jgi:hypothetical protein
MGNFAFETSGSLSDSMDLSRPVFITPAAKPQNNQILVGRSGKSGEYLGPELNALLITQGHIPEEMRERFACVLIFEAEVDLCEVANFIHAVFDVFDEWQADLADMVKDGCSLKQILDRSQTIFGNPIMIIDSHLQLIAYSSMIDAQPKLHILLEQANSPDLPSNYQLYQDFRQTFSVEQASYFPADYTGIRSVYKNIFANGRVLLCRVLVPEMLRSLEDSDLTLLDILCEYVFALIRQEQRADIIPLSLSSVLRRILEKNPPEEHIVEQTLQSYSWIAGCEFFSMKLKTDYIDTQNRTAFSIINYLQTHVNACCALDFDQGIAAFVNLTLNGGRADDILHGLTAFICDMNLRVGVSNACKRADRPFLSLYMQAGKALEIGERYQPFQWIHHFHNLCDKYLLESCLSEFTVDLVAAPEILAALNYDREYGTEYLSTLKTYLDNNLQAVKTAQQLFIHRSTFIYRMKKITERFHINLDDPQKRRFYELSIALLDSAGNRDRTEPARTGK